MNTSRKPLETGPARMSALARLPVFLALEGKRAVLAGGSAAAAWKAELLAAAGAQVDVYASEASDELLQVAADPPRGAVTINRRGWTADDLKGPRSLSAHSKMTRMPLNSPRQRARPAFRST